MQLNRIRQSGSEIAREAQSETHGVPPRHRRGSTWDTVQRVALAGFGVLGTVALLGLAACPADLANPSDYDHPGSLTPGGASGVAGSGSSAGGGGSMTQPGLQVDTTCLQAVFTARCGLPGCHAAPAQLTGLDLSSPNVNTRLNDVGAKFMLADPNTGCKAGQKLVDASNPDDSWLVQKLTTDGKSCGSVMPIGDPLTDDQVACIKKYVADVAAAKASGM